VGLLASGVGVFFHGVCAEGPQSANRAAAPAAPVPQPKEVGPSNKEASQPGAALPGGAIARLGSAKLSHGGTIFFVHYLAGDQELLTVGRDDTMRLWQVATGKELRRFEWWVDPKAKPEPLEKALQDALEKQAGIMGMPNGLVDQLVGLGTDHVFPVAVSPDGKYVAALKHRSLQIWDTATGKRLETIKGSMPANRGGLPLDASLTFSSDSKRLLVADAGKVQSWDVATGKHSVLAQPANFEFMPGGVVSQDGKYLAWQTVDIQNQAFSVKVKDLAAGKTVADIKADFGGVSNLQFAPDGKTLAWATPTTGVHLFEIGKDKEGRLLGQAQPTEPLNSFCFAPDSKSVAVARRDQTVELWDVATGKKVRQLGEAARQNNGAGMLVLANVNLFERTADMAFSSDGSKLAASFGGTQVRQFDVATGKEIAAEPSAHRKTVSLVQVSADNQKVTTCAPGDAVSVWDLATGKQIRHLKLPADTNGAALSGDAGIAVTAAGNDIEVWDLAGGKLLRQFRSGEEPIAALAMTADGKTLALRDQASRIRLWDPATGKELRQLADELPPVGNGTDVVVTEITGVLTLDIAFSPDGRFLIGADALHRLCLWETATGTRLWEVTLPAGKVVDGFAFSPNGRSLAALFHDGAVDVYETITVEKRCRLSQSQGKKGGGNLGFMVGGQTLTFPRNRTDMPLAAAFSPDSRFLAISQSESLLHLWDVIAAKEVAAFAGHGGKVTAAAFAPNGKHLVAACLDTTALVWPSAEKMKKDLAAGDPLTAKTLESLWVDFCGKDGSRAFEAIRQLLRHPKQGVALLEQHVQPVPAPDAKRVSQLVGDLNHPKFDVRQQATAELEKLGELVVPNLQKQLQGDITLEARQRVETLLKRLSQSSTKGVSMRDLRAVEWLELQGGPEARRLLERLATGAAGARLTIEARGALQRLAS
jgi:WD40 repeat protein